MRLPRAGSFPSKSVFLTLCCTSTDGSSVQLNWNVAALLPAAESPGRSLTAGGSTLPLCEQTQHKVSWEMTSQIYTETCLVQAVWSDWLHWCD